MSLENQNGCSQQAGREAIPIGCGDVFYWEPEHKQVEREDYHAPKRALGETAIGHYVPDMPSGFIRSIMDRLSDSDIGREDKV